jgi:hypothetical protein
MSIACTPIMHTTTLRRVLLGAMAASIAACSGTKESTTVETGGPLSSPFVCSSGQETYEALRVATQRDYLELRRVNLDNGTDASVPKPVVELAAGTKCGNASAPASCTTAVDALSASSFLFPSCGGCPGGGTYLVFTKGDEVGKVTSGAELRSFLGTIDAPAKAWLQVTNANYDINCKQGWIREAADGYVILASKMLSDCPIQTQDVVLHVARDGSITVTDTHDNPETHTCIGRRPAGLLAGRRRSGCSSDVGAHFARIARLEAASVDAFRILRAELAAHGAPRRLLVAAERAARDEIRHARAMARIARRHGGVVEAPRVVRGPVRSLVEIAIENAVEGCVRETYGALEGMWQAHAAADPAIRAAMKAIALDETRHGAFSWTLAEWLDTRLTSAERRRVRAARTKEVEAITQRLGRGPDAELVRVAGVPNAAQASALAAHLRETLWAA